jgi:hypothetical protein
LLLSQNRAQLLISSDQFFAFLSVLTTFVSAVKNGASNVDPAPETATATAVVGAFGAVGVPDFHAVRAKARP